MSSNRSKALLEQGFDIKGTIRDNRNAQQANQIAQLLKAQQFKNAQGAGQGIQLQNDAQRLQNQTQPQRADLNRRIGEAELKRFNAPDPIKIPQQLYAHLPPEIQGNPTSVTTRDLIQAAETKKAFDAKKSEDEALKANAKGNPDGLRKEFTKNTGDFAKVNDAYGRITASASNPTAAGDLSLIFNFMKVLDPGFYCKRGRICNSGQLCRCG